MSRLGEVGHECILEVQIYVFKISDFFLVLTPWGQRLAADCVYSQQ